MLFLSGDKRKMIKSEGWTDKKGRRRKCKNEGLPGSFTVEASWIMAFIFDRMVTIFQNAARIHDETAQAMKLHQAVEKGDAMERWKI